MTISLFNLVGDRAIKRGSTYKRFTISLAGDKSLWTARGSIRDNYKENNGTVLVNWRFILDPTYDAEANMTTFYPTLTVEDTTNDLLLPTILQSETKTPKIGIAYVTDFEFESPDGDVVGTNVVFVQVKHEVT